MRLNGNHRTAFIIDLKNQTVEFYNSFSSDSQVRKPLTQLAVALSIKYHRPFVYKHVTEGSNLQKDTHQCGVWACKFIEERLKNGKDYKPHKCSSNEMNQYRTIVFDAVYVHRVYHNLGQERLIEYLKEIFPKLANIGTGIFFSKLTTYQEKYFYNIEVDYYALCETGKISDTFNQTVIQIQKEEPWNDDE